jgi:hypothetical protein
MHVSWAAQSLLSMHSVSADHAVWLNAPRCSVQRVMHCCASLSEVAQRASASQTASQLGPPVAASELLLPPQAAASHSAQQAHSRWG